MHLNTSLVCADLKIIIDKNYIKCVSSNIVVITDVCDDNGLEFELVVMVSPRDVIDRIFEDKDKASLFVDDSSQRGSMILLQIQDIAIEKFIEYNEKYL